MPIFPPDPVAQKTPTYIGEIRYEFTDATGRPQGYTSAIFVQVLDQENLPLKNASVRNVGAHLTAQERAQLTAIFVRLRSEAEKELLK